MADTDRTLEPSAAHSSGRQGIGACAYVVLVAIVSLAPIGNRATADAPAATGVVADRARQLEHGRYLATIGVCAACHTPPAVGAKPPDANDAGGQARERQFRTDPDWFRYLDPSAINGMAGGVPFILRVPNLKTGKLEYGTVITPNITPYVGVSGKDTPGDGLGNWTAEEVKAALRQGVRRNGRKLFLFAPHTFFRYLADDDLDALVVYLKEGIAPIKQVIAPPTLPQDVIDQYWEAANADAGPRAPARAPSGRNLERAQYLMRGLVGCAECHSYRTFSVGKPPVWKHWVGGDPADPYEGAFRLGPDLPLRVGERGLATFPYPGYAVLYGGNLTRFGNGGDLSHVGVDKIVRAMRQGVSTEPDRYGREKPLAHVMPWQFYSSMRDEDAYAIADFLKTLRFVPHEIPEGRLTFYGEDWAAAFKRVFGAEPTEEDCKAFGKSRPQR